MTGSASGGKEFFLSFENKEKKILFAFLRLRLPPRHETIFRALDGAAIIREIHTYGTVQGISKRGTESSQHQGFGKKLLAEAEYIAKNNGYKKIAVISGIGSREYYKKLGYRRAGTYMMKRMKK